MVNYDYLIALGESTGNSSVITALSNAFTSIAGDLTTTITTVLPIALGVVGMIMVVRFGIKFFKRNVR